MAWVAFKIGVLSNGGGFVIIPLMHHDAVSRYHRMTATQVLRAVALGQITPGAVVRTVAVVGYAAAGVAEGLIAAGVAFAPWASVPLAAALQHLWQVGALALAGGGILGLRRGVPVALLLAAAIGTAAALAGAPIGR